MGVMITTAQRDGLRDLSNKVGKSLTELIEVAITRVLDGEITLPIKDLGERTPVSVYLPYEKEVAIKTLSKETKIPSEEIFRIAIRELLANSQPMIDKAQVLAQVQAEQAARKVKSSKGLAKTLQDRRAALMDAESDEDC